MELALIFSENSKLYWNNKLILRTFTCLAGSFFNQGSVIKKRKMNFIPLTMRGVPGQKLVKKRLTK